MKERTPQQTPNIFRSDPRASRLIAYVKTQIDEALQRPFIVSVMGQTGVGKSSLINALFGTNLKVDPVRPCTKEIERVVTRDGTEKELWFYDLPGIGESHALESAYLSQYRQQLLESDVVLWTLHADNRSLAYDLSSLQALLSEFDRAFQAQLMSKVTFVLTKVDLLASPPWILARTGETAFLTPGREIRRILGLKCRYCEEAFLVPHEHLLVAQTYNDGAFDLQDDRLSFDEHTVSYRGLLTEERAAEMAMRHQKHRAVFDRLLDNHRVIACSSRFRFNLAQLMVVIVNKLGLEAAGRFARYVSKEEMNSMSIVEARRLCNLIVFDAVSKRRLFDLTEHQI